MLTQPGSSSKEKKAQNPSVTDLGATSTTQA